MFSPRSTLPLAAILLTTTLIVTALTPSSAHAQEPPPPPPGASETDSDIDADASDVPPPPPPVDDLGESDVSTSQGVDTTGEADDEDGDYEYWDSKPKEPQPGKRIALEGLGGLGGMAGGYLVGGFGGALAGAIINPDPYSALIGAAIGLGVGGLFGTPLGIWAAGNSVDGNGSYWTTLGGTTLGFMAAGLLSAALQNAAPGVGGLGGVVLPITGGVIAYELSNTGTQGNAVLNKPGLRLGAGFSQPQRGEGAVLIFRGSW